MFRPSLENFHHMRDLLSKIERAVKARGWSARQASMQAVGTPELFHDIRRGRVPSVERFRTLCQALETTDRALASRGRRMGHADKAQAVAAVYDLMGRRRAEASTTRIAQLIEAVAKSRGYDQGIGS